MDVQTIKTDDYPPYNALDEKYHHLGEVVKAHEAQEKLPWVHILIGNAKSFIRGTYHGVSHKHLQSYLSEFCYRFNRRFNEKQMTDRILTACLFTTNITYAELLLRWLNSCISSISDIWMFEITFNMMRPVLKSFHK